MRKPLEVTAGGRPEPGTAGSAGPAVGRRYLIWLFGVSGSLLGDAALYFALGWAASAYGGSAAGAVLTAVALPRVALLLVGGAVSDRRGARQVMIVGDALMIVVTISAALLSGRFGSPLWLLLAIGLCVGVVNAFYLPASGSLPRQLVADPALPQALAMRQTVGNAVALLGAPLGGFLISVSGLGAVLVFDAVTFVLMILILLLVIWTPRRARSAVASSVVSEIRAGLGLVAREPVLRATLILVGGAAGFLLPVVSLMVPLLARDNGWTVSTTGAVIGAFTGSSAMVAVLALWRGVGRRAGLLSAVGLLIAGGGVVILGFTGEVWFSVLGSAVAGGGTGLFGIHVGPLILRSTPQEYLARVQSINVLSQSIPLLLANNAFGALSDRIGPRPVVLVCGGVTVAVGLYGCVNRPSRSAVFG